MPPKVTPNDGPALRPDVDAEDAAGVTEEGAGEITSNWDFLKLSMGFSAIFSMLDFSG